MQFELAIPWDFLEKANHASRILVTIERCVGSRQTFPVLIGRPLFLLQLCII